MELFKMESGTELFHVPYSTQSVAFAALLSGEIDAIINPCFGPLLQYVKNGDLRVLAVLAGKRAKEFPGVPTLAESGYPDIETYVWYGLFAPAGLSRNVLARLNDAVNQAIMDPNVRNPSERQGLHFVGGSPQRLIDLMNADYAKWSRVVRRAGIKAD